MKAEESTTDLRRYVYEEKLLEGHRQGINCVKWKKFSGESRFSSLQNRNLIFTGSDDRTVRVWDAANLRSIKCFASHSFLNGIDLIDFHPTNDSIIFASSLNRVVSLNISTPNVIEREVQSLFVCPEIKGEINTFAVHPSKLMLALTDDEFNVFLVTFSEDGIFDTSSVREEAKSSPTALRSFRKFHTNIIYSLLFTTHLKRDEIYMGGFDCELSYWELERVNRPTKTTKLSVVDEYHTETQTLNPPFIYSISLLQNNKVLLLGLGDGSIRLYHSSQFMLYTQKLIHSGAITTVKVLNNFIITAGNAELHFLSHYIYDECLSPGVDQWIYCHELLAQTKKRSPPQYQLELVWSIQHSDKVNMLDGNLTEDGKIHLFVSDTTSQLHFYDIYVTS